MSHFLACIIPLSALYAVQLLLESLSPDIGNAFPWAIIVSAFVYCSIGNYRRDRALKQAWRR